MLRDRILTALILIPLFLAIVLLLPPKHFAIVTGIIMIISAWEWSSLMGLSGFPKKIVHLLLAFLMHLPALEQFWRRFLSAPLFP